MPGLAPDRLEPGVAAALGEIDGGTAVRTSPLSLERVRAAIGPCLPDGVDATIYPVAD